MKNCIFHIPYKLDIEAKAAPMLRPRKMIQAFQELGYNVEVVSGYSNERKGKILQIKKNIDNGIVYDFMYSESSTMPTILTDIDHMPRHPLMDFDFFKFLKKHGVKIGLFYRDIHWKFDLYKKGTSGIKAKVAIYCYKNDLKKYNRFVDVFYMPTKQAYEYVCKHVSKIKYENLPPGAENCVDTPNKNIDNGKLNIFYVGGLGDIYQLVELVHAVSQSPFCHLTLCCRKREWDNVKENYEKFLNDNISIIHKNNDELLDYYCQSDVCSLVFNRNVYMDMAMPYKTFEYLSHVKPIIATKGTAAGDFIEKNGIGWVVEYNAESIKYCLKDIWENKNQYSQIVEKCKQARSENLWLKRAEQVVSGLGK